MSNIFQSMLTAFTAAVIVLVADKAIPRAEPVQVEPVQVEPEASEQYVLIGTWNWGMTGVAVTPEFSSEAACEVGAEVFRANLSTGKPDSFDTTKINTTCIPK